MTEEIESNVREKLNNRIRKFSGFSGIAKAVLKVKSNISDRVIADKNSKTISIEGVNVSKLRDFSTLDEETIRGIIAEEEDRISLYDSLLDALKEKKTEYAFGDDIQMVDNHPMIKTNVNETNDKLSALFQDNFNTKMNLVVCAEREKSYLNKEAASKRIENPEDVELNVIKPSNNNFIKKKMIDVREFFIGRAAKKAGRVSLKGFKKFEKELITAFNNKDFVAMDAMTPTFDELYSQGTEARRLYEEYVAYVDAMEKEYKSNGNRYSIDSLVEKSKKWNEMYSKNVEYWENARKYSSNNALKLLQAKFEAHLKNPANAAERDSNGNILVNVGEERMVIRPDHRYTDIKDFYKKLKAYESDLQNTQSSQINANSQQQEQEPILNVVQGKPISTLPKKNDIPEMPTQDLVKDEPNENTLDITPNMQAYIDLLKLSGCSNEKAIEIATDPVTSDKFKKFDETRGVTAYENAISTGIITEDTTLGQFQLYIAKQECNHLYETDFQSDVSHEKIVEEQQPELSTASDDEVSNDYNALGEIYEESAFDPAEEINSATTRPMTAQEIAARANLQNLPGKDLTGYDVFVHPENESGSLFYEQGQQSVSTGKTR